MVVEPVGRWALSAVFAVAAACYLYGLTRSDQRGPGLRLITDDALHVLMAVAMIAMLWSWGSAIPVMAYVLVFTAAALWFVAGLCSSRRQGRLVSAIRRSLLDTTDLLVWRGITR